jgi:predicted nucleotidyltransferase
MEQKLYNHEIVLNLLKGENHLRQTAKELKINHMTIKRHLDFMIRENVLDVKKEGKNNIFSIKNSIEAHNAVLAAEIYRLNRLIKKHTELKREILELKKFPAIVMIFGSYAKETESKDSDIDIFIETKDKGIKNHASKLNERFSIKIGKYDKNDLLIKEIEKNHVIIRGFEEFYEKKGFFDKIA